MRILSFILPILVIAAGSGYFATKQWSVEQPALASAEPHDHSHAPEPKKPLYYRNPMGLPDTSPVPKKDEMGMDYIPVYAEEAAPEEPAAVTLSVQKMQRSGVRSEAVETRVMTDAIHVPGSVQFDERRQRAVTMRVEGFIEEVYAGTAGQTVKAGEPLFRIFSPDIISAQADYRAALAKGNGEVTARKLRNLGLSEIQIKSFARKGAPPSTLDWPSPVEGVLVSKTIVAGQRVAPGDELFRLADVSIVWVLADVPEQEIGRIKIGDSAAVTVRALPGDSFTGTVAAILPELKPETRTAQVRIELKNPGGKLLNRMYADVTIAAAQATAVPSVPASAVIDSGLRQVAIVDLGDGKFAPRPVKVGRRGGDYVEILDGLKPGERVVTKANFLIDAESNLKAALAGLAP